MKSNREELAAAARVRRARTAPPRSTCGSSRRPTGVDVGNELLSDEDRATLDRELASAARDAVRRGIRLASYPEFERPRTRPRGLVPRVRAAALADPRRTRPVRVPALRLVPEASTAARTRRATTSSVPTAPSIRASTGIGSRSASIPARASAASPRARSLRAILDGVRSGRPIGTCATCGERRTALYRPRLAFRAGGGRAADASGLTERSGSGRQLPEARPLRRCRERPSCPGLSRPPAAPRKAAGSR